MGRRAKLLGGGAALVAMAAAVAGITLFVLTRSEPAGLIEFPSSVAADERLLAELRPLVPSLPVLQGASDRDQIRSVLGPPDTFQVAFEREGEGATPVRRETWVYFDLLTAYEFVDGRLVSNLPVDEVSGPALAPRQYDPHAFRHDMTIEDVEKLLTEPEKAARTQVPPEMGGNVSAIAGEQLVAVLDDQGLEYVETFTLEPGVESATGNTVQGATRLMAMAGASDPPIVGDAGPRRGYAVNAFNPLGLVRALVRTIVNIERRGDAYEQIGDQRDRDLKDISNEERQNSFLHDRGWRDDPTYLDEQKRLAALRQAVIDRAEREKQVERAYYNRAIGQTWVAAARSAILNPAGIDARTQRLIEGVVTRQDPIRTSLNYLAETTAANAPEAVERLQEVQRRLRQGQEAMLYVVDPSRIPIQQRLAEFQEDLAALAAQNTIMGLTQSELERRLQDLRTRGADIEQFIDTTSRAWIELSTRNVRPNQQRFAQDRRWDEMNAAIRLLRVSPAAEALLGGIVRSAEERVRRIAAEQGITLSESDVARILARTTVEIMAARAQAQAEGGNPAELDIDGLLQAALQGGVAETPTVTVTVTPPVAAYVARGSFDASVFPSGWGTISENRVEIVFPREGGAVTGSSLMTFEDFPIGSLMAMVEEGITGGVSEETRAFAASCTCRLVIEATFTGTYDVASGSLSGSLASTPRLVDDKGCLANRPSSFTTRPEDAMSAGTAVWKATFDGRELTGTTFDETGERIGSFRASVE